MPSITYLGPFYERRQPHGHGSWLRGKEEQVTQEWLNEWRHRLPITHFRIEGDEGVTVDGGNDGIPDSGWSRKDILKWLTDNGVSRGSGYLTKSAALALVEGHLNPTE
tara:strand:- start:18 stop:341 length:324 start_codon:yes stop_codon:yes gene_type:complete